MQWVPFFLICWVATAQAIEPNFEDIDDAKEQPQNEVLHKRNQRKLRNKAPNTLIKMQ